MNFVFDVVAGALIWIGSVTGFTYNEINVIVYYILLPFVYVALLDRIIRKHILKIAYVVGWIIALCVIPDFNAFSNSVFKHSVDFLRMFSAIGLNYVAASVVICVILPAIVFAVMVFVAFPRMRPRLLARKSKSPPV